MLHRAPSLKPCPERDYLAKEAEAQRLAARPPCPYATARNALDALEHAKGSDEALRLVEEWRRPRKDARKAKRAEPKVVYIRNGVPLFKGEGGHG